MSVHCVSHGMKTRVPRPFNFYITHNWQVHAIATLHLSITVYTYVSSPKKLVKKRSGFLTQENIIGLQPKCNNSKGVKYVGSIRIMNHTSGSYVVRTLKIVGVHHEENSSAKIPYITIWQYWLGNTKPKKAFRLILNAFKKLLQNLKKNI